jgi:leader peptidase (prepilin peptidase)/N-methyltransferase
MLEAAPFLIAFVFGTIIGSFLNVVSLRFRTGIGLGGRSMCMKCGKMLTWKELIPIVSFLYQRGACKGCKSRISWQYPLVEFAAGIVFASICFRFPPLTSLTAITTAAYLLATCLLLPIAAYDWKHKIIPDQLVYAFDTIALASVFIGGASWLHAPHLATLLAGPIIALPFAFLWLVSKGTWMGLGDAKLALGIGWLLGLNGGVNAVILAFWVGAILGVIFMVATYKRYKSRLEIPFGPYLILGMYLALLGGIQVIDVHTLAALFRV